MQYRLLITTLLCLIAQSAFSQFSLSGTILEQKTKEPVEYAMVVINDNELWAVTNDKGEFTLRNVARGEVRIAVSCLGYVKSTFVLNVTDNIENVTYYLAEDNLTLSEVVVTAQNKTSETTTAYRIDRAALDHLQMLSASDILTLLPGAQTANRQYGMAVNSPELLTLRAGSYSEAGDPSFGTAIEVDGVRLSNNASIGVNLSDSNAPTRTSYGGRDSRNIASSNIESVELITGIASVVYGDMTNGVFKINTRKGASPYLIEMKTNPNTQSFSVNKGFRLKGNSGVLNASAERAKSIANPASPYTSYDRNNFSLTYDNTFNQDRRPLSFTFGITGNIGGYNTKADPDAFRETFTQVKDNEFRAHTRINYLPNLSWLTNLLITASINYNDNLVTKKVNQSSSSSVASVHGTEEGYFVGQLYDEHNPNQPIIMIPPGYWYNTGFSDNKPITISAGLQARWIKSVGALRNNLLLGGDFKSTGNLGKGVYHDDMQYAPHKWREFRFDQLPYMNTVALFLEDEINIKIGRSNLQLRPALRSDMTFISGSDYGNVNALSPRFSARFNTGKVNIRAGYGKFVKLPSFNTLFPEPDYTDSPVFATSVSGSENFSAYYILPRHPKFNPDLRWQYDQKWDLGVDTRIKGVSISLSAYQSQTLHSYVSAESHEPFSFNYTDIRALDGCPIPYDNRQFAIDQYTGVVTVMDKTGSLPNMELAYITRNTFKRVPQPINGSPVLRRGVEWSVDFGKIQALQTSIRWDGNFYYYKYVDEIITSYLQAGNMANGTPYKYLMYFVGGQGTSNGSFQKHLFTNLTLTTHIPAVRFVVTLKIEGSLYNHTQNLSEYQGKPHGYVLDNSDDVLPSESRKDIYAGDQYMIKYPLYYVSLDDLNTQIPFLESFRDAKENNPTLYTELLRVIRRSSFTYYFNPIKYTAYATAHLNITKEIGDVATISFIATNFLSTMQLVKSSQTGLYQTAPVPAFYYGIALKIKI